MSRWTILAVLLGVLLLAAPISRVMASEDEYAGEEDDGEVAPKGDDVDDVVVLGGDNFEAVVGASKFALVEFYAPWCGHCKTLAPHYAKAAAELKATHPDIVIGKVDATQHAELSQKFGVQGYPTLKWFIGGDTETPVEYQGGRDAEGILKWVTRKSGPTFTTADDVDALATKEAEAEVIMLGYFTEFSGPDYEAFIAASQKVEDVAFVQTTSADVATAATLAGPGFVIIKNFKTSSEVERVIMTGEISIETLTTFIGAEKLPLTIEFSSSNTDKIFQSGISKQIIVWAKSSDLAVGTDFSTALNTVASRFKGKLIFVTTDNEGPHHEPITNFFGLKDQVGVAVLGFQMDANKKYQMPGAFSEEALDTFAQSLYDDTLQANFKSADIPEGEEAFDGGVAIIVGKNFDVVVKDETRDVLLEVYAPWCGHCKSLEPTYKKLAKRFKNIDSVVIAKMDGTENEHPDIEIKGYPYIAIFPAGGDSEPIVFEGGDRSIKALTKFIKSNAKIDFDLKKKDTEAETETEEKDEL